MVEVVFALLLIVDNKIVEHRIQDSLSNCLKAKRYAMKDKSAKDRVTYQCLKSKRYAMKDKSSKDRVVYKCIKSKANIEIYMGEKKITSLILD